MLCGEMIQAYITQSTQISSLLHAMFISDIAQLPCDESFNIFSVNNFLLSSGFFHLTHYHLKYLSLAQHLTHATCITQQSFTYPGQKDFLKKYSQRR